MNLRPRNAGLLIATIVALSLSVVATASASSGSSRGAASAAPSRQLQVSQLESGVLSQINAVRSQHGLVPLRFSVPLTLAARNHSESMAAKGYFTHESADGGAFWKRVQNFYPSTSRRFWSVGENLLWQAPDVDPSGALQMWMNSPEHKANLLTARWREVGISAVHATAAPGVYGGLDVTIVTADFGVRS
jgi:uncharacterized protein YkwD